MKTTFLNTIATDPTWFEFVFNHVTDGILIVDREMNLVAVNETACKITGEAEENLLSQPYLDVFPFKQSKQKCLVRRAAKNKRPIINIIDTLALPGQEVIPISISAVARFDAENNFVGGLIIFRDISELNKLKDTLKRTSVTDQLTGLFNRDHMMALLELEFTKARRYKNDISIMLVDIDNFKQINTRLGKLAADKVLQKVADLLRNNVRMSDVIGRYEEDEFLLILPNSDGRAVVELASRISYLVERNAIIESASDFSVTVSIGTASFPNFKISEWKDMIKAADIALYMAKEIGISQTESF